MASCWRRGYRLCTGMCTRACGVRETYAPFYVRLCPHWWVGGASKITQLSTDSLVRWTGCRGLPGWGSRDILLSDSGNGLSDLRQINPNFISAGLVMGLLGLLE